IINTRASLMYFIVKYNKIKNGSTQGAKLEEASEDENLLIQEFAIDRYHIERKKLSGVGVYT
ncbi:MAG: hypothetical protein ACD_21C00309G0001, partial [uncultured bacterium]